MWVDGGGSGSCNNHGVRASRGFLFLHPFLAKFAVGWLMDSPRHVVLTPMGGEITMFLFLGFAIFRWDLLPCFILFLVFLVGHVFLVFCLALFLNAIPLVIASTS